ncbi:hypothetical protein [Prochlorococcus marinus]|uniref:Uncharacterized protein n=1 Tax=Prochlorococcus marinus (strain MIT 9303) TaxID=59922 RepID=A2C5W5_PROM3|nr:hypothetical protein [Prochlorococcus marinus]ABM76875.1 Hypothetical protein P9303_01201 [Prochlorococcus marinus str. MIT 9303]
MKIDLYDVGPAICLKYWETKVLYTADLSIDKVEVDTNQYILHWLIYETRLIFMGMPYDSIEISLTPQLSENQKDSLSPYSQILLKSNSFLRDNRKLKGIAENWSTLLIVGYESRQYQSFINWVNDEIQSSEHMILNSGIDGTENQGNRKGESISANQLIEKIKEHKIGSLVFENFDVIIDIISSAKINVLCLLRFMGVKVMLIGNNQFDLYSYGYIQAAAFNVNMSYKNMRLLSEYWDNKFNQEVEYIAIPADFRENKDIRLLNEYKIVVFANSWFNNIEAWKAPVEGILSKLENPLTDLPLWYLSAHKLLQTADKMRYELSRQFRNIYLLYFYCQQRIKVEVIKSLSTKKNIEVYGDEGWLDICPNSYKGVITKEGIEAKLKDEIYINLLTDYGFTYLDHSAQMCEMISNDYNWINLAAVVRNKELSGMSSIEYSTFDELNELIENAQEAIKKAKPSIKYLKSLYYNSTHRLINKLKSSEQNNGSRDNSFTESWYEHKKLVDQKLNEYIEKNEYLLRGSLELTSRIVLNN